MSKRSNFLPLIIFISTVFNFGCSPEDADSPLPEDFFIKYYGSNETEVVVDVLPYNDGFLLLGSTNISGDKDYLLVKTDGLGNELWKKQIGFVRGENSGEDTPSEMIQYDDNNVAIIGTTTVDIGADILASRVFLVIVDVSADDDAVIVSNDLIYPQIPAGVSNAEILAKNSEGSSLLRPSDINGVQESALILVGSSDSIDVKVNPQPTDIQDIYMSKVNLDLTSTDPPDWEIVFGFTGEDRGIKVLQSSNGFNVIASTDATSNTGGGGKNVQLSIINLDGVVQNSIIFGSGTDEIPVDIVVDGDNITILGNSTGGTNGQEAFLIGVTSFGTTIFAQQQISIDVAAISNSGNIGNGLIRLQDGNYFVTGQLLGYSDPATNLSKGGDVFLYKTDQFGNIDQTSVQVYGGIGNDFGKTLIQNADQTLMIGATIDFQGGTTMMSLIKTNSKGEFAK